jgi:hypothetical protein
MGDTPVKVRGPYASSTKNILLIIQVHFEGQGTEGNQRSAGCEGRKGREGWKGSNPATSKAWLCCPCHPL